MLAVHQHALSLCQACDAQLEQVLRSLYPALLHLDGQDVPVAMSEAVDHQLDPLFLHEAPDLMEDPRCPQLAVEVSAGLQDEAG
jgi:hypothetical protein